MTIRTRRAAVDQLGFVTDNLDHSVKLWTEAFGVGPWQIYRNVQLDGQYLGEATTVTIDVALGYRGTEQIEFIQVTSSTPSPYQDANGKALNGLHHLAWIVDDLASEAAALQKQGLKPVFTAANAAVDVIYLADPQSPGVLYELISGAGSRQQHDDGQDAARLWDGTNLITEIDFAALG